MKVRLVGVLGCSLVMFACGDDSPLQPDAALPVDAAPIDTPPPIVTAEEQAALSQLSPLPAVPADPTNAYANNAAAAKLGQMLFFDKSYAGALAVGDDGSNGGLGATGSTGKVSCHSCHGVGSSDLDDQRSKPNNVSLGTNFGTRNALGMVNSSFYTWTNWGGRFDSQWSLPLAVAENPGIMNSTRLAVAHLLYDKYRVEYNAVFPVPLDAALDPTTGDLTRFPLSGKPGQAAFDNLTTTDKDIVNVIFANYGKALQAYMRTLVSRNAPFDRFVAGDHTALSASAIRGMKLFLAKKCVDCHSGPNFSDNQFHALLVPQTGAHVPATDLGRHQDVPALLASPFNTNSVYSDDRTTGRLANLVQVDGMKGQFRTKSLRHVALSGPFMHAGQFATLGDVMTFYDQGGGDVGTTGIIKDPKIVPLALSAQDKLDLVEFMGSLTGEAMPATVLTDTSK